MGALSAVQGQNKDEGAEENGINQFPAFLPEM